MKPVAMLLLAVALTAAAWWWFTSEMPHRERERAKAAEVAVARAEQASSLYRWRDANGVLQITEDPPKGRKYERIGREPKDGIVIDGARQ